MIRIRRLFTEPALIDPIVFDSGLNLIVGDRDDSSNKTNGVGKSLCIEFVNFALLKSKSASRVSRIPEDSFPPETYVCLDFKLGDTEYTIKRSLAEHDRPVIHYDGGVNQFSSVNDAAQFLTERMFADPEMEYPSFRVMLGPLIRDERSEFKSLVGCYDTGAHIPPEAPDLVFQFGDFITDDLKPRKVLQCINVGLYL